MRTRKMPDRLQVAMILSGVRQADIAQACNVGVPMVCGTLAGTFTSAKVVVATAHLLGKSERWVRQQIAARRQSRRPAINPATHPEAAAAAAGHPDPELAGFTPEPIGE